MKYLDNLIDKNNTLRESRRLNEEYYGESFYQTTFAHGLEFEIARNEFRIELIKAFKRFMVKLKPSFL